MLLTNTSIDIRDDMDKSIYIEIVVNFPSFVIEIVGDFPGLFLCITKLDLTRAAVYYQTNLVVA